MRSIVALTAALLLHATAWSEDFHFSPAGVGLLTVKSEIEKSGKTVRIIATATNDSGVPIRKAVFCIQNRQAKPGDCAGRFWNTGVWQPGTTFRSDLSLPYSAKSRSYAIEVELLVRDEARYYVNTLYVDELQGNNRDMARDQLKALIVNTGWFTLVEDRASAQAILKGRAETREAGSESSASGQAAAAGGIWGSRVGALGASASNSASQGITKTIIEEGIVLRVTLPTGENLWAWDDSKPCPQTQKTKCVIDDLVETFKPPYVPAAIR